MVSSSCIQLSNDCEIVTAKNFDEIEAIRPIWEQMQHNEPFAVPNADVRRYVAGIKALGDEAQPYIVLAKLGGCPAAMVIGRIGKHPVAFRLGYKTISSPILKCLSIVYGGVIGQPSRELCSLLLSDLTGALRRREADVVFFNHLRTDSPVSQLCETMPHFVTRSHCVSAESHWQTDIPKSVDEFYSRIPKSRKQRWCRNFRNLEKMSSSGFNVVCYRDINEVEYLIDVVCRIERSTYKNGLNIGFTDSVLNRALLEQAARDDWLRAYVLYIGDEPCAFQLDIQYDKVQFTEYGSFNPRWGHGSPGIVLLLKVLEELCGDMEVVAMDYGFGNASYKEKLGTNCWLEKSVYIYAPRLHPIVVNMAMFANLAFSRVLNWTAAHLNLDSSIKRYWRRMMCNGRETNCTQE
jgi:CelD/BcsL family acetyltransferase involved in cellulose biosynthesis